VSLTRKFIKIILIPTSAQHDVTRHGAPADPFITEFAYADQSADGDSTSSLFPERGFAYPRRRRPSDWRLFLERYCDRKR